jgi:hypothetical protein
MPPCLFDNPFGKRLTTKPGMEITGSDVIITSHIFFIRYPNTPIIQDCQRYRLTKTPVSRCPVLTASDISDQYCLHFKESLFINFRSSYRFLTILELPIRFRDCFRLGLNGIVYWRIRHILVLGK